MRPDECFSAYKLMYCLVLWRPQFKKEIIRFKNVQRRETKYILKDYSADYFTGLQQLNLLPLVYHFEISDIIFAVHQHLRRGVQGKLPLQTAQLPPKSTQLPPPSPPPPPPPKILPKERILGQKILLSSYHFRIKHFWLCALRRKHPPPALFPSPWPYSHTFHELPLQGEIPG